MNKLIIIAMTISCVLLVSCAPNNSLTNENSSNSVIILGDNLNSLYLELNLHFSPNEIEEIYSKDDKTVDEQLAFLSLLSGGASSGKLGEFNNLQGNFTYVCYPISTGIDVDYIPIMILQGFKKEELTENACIMVNDKAYNLSELNEFIVYESDLLIVFDLRFLLSNMSLNAYIRTLDIYNKDIPNIDIDLMQKIYNKLVSLPDGILTPST